MVARRLALVALASLALAVCAASARADGVPAPTGLHGFLLRADEPATTTFARTPAFAWNPVQGAASYEFQLSTSSQFRESGIVWKCPSATCQTLDSPVAAPSLDLPWITGTPHGLYARVRAVLPDGTKSEWSDAFGFDVVPSAAPTPQAAPPGVIRWSPIPGATEYEVWLVDAGKHEFVYTNVLDEREFYTLHESPQWVGTVRWRVRAVRGTDLYSNTRVNGLPISAFGPWSPIYKSTNPSPTGGPIQLGETISDVVSTGKPSDPAQRLMPAFTWSGNQTLDGDSAELFRVYVFTDKACLNPVFTSSVIGGRAYAPRPFGGLALPSDTTGIQRARSVYLDDLSTRTAEPLSLSLDDELLTSTENQKQATPTVTLPLIGPGASATAQSQPFFTFPGNFDPGAPVSLWDTDWPQSGYYWTVVPVEMNTGAAGATLAASAPKGSTTVIITGQPGFKVGDSVVIGSGVAAEPLTIAAIAGSAVTFTTATLVSHNQGDPIVRLGAGVAYQDMELPQDVCAAGRVQRFGYDSEPSLIAGDNPFASGLSASGKLTSAVGTDSFYRSPVISWTPALGADLYEVQVSKSASPFVPVPNPQTNAEGTLTGATSLVLTGLAPGTWYYRVRGVDWSLPTNSQWMGWSDPAKIVVSNPDYRVVSSVKPATAKKKPKPTAPRR